jgi:hypothetical protein
MVMLVPDVNYLSIKFRCPYRCKRIIQIDTDSNLNLLDTRGCWKFKEEALDRTVWRTRFGRGYGPVVRHTTK